jgi:hypothetical protein
MRSTLKALAVAAAHALLASTALGDPGYVTGDCHQHTIHTDGSYKMSEDFLKANYFGLDWWANSEHGGYNAQIGGQTSYRWQDFYGDTNRPLGVYVPQTITKSGKTYKSTFQEVLLGRQAYPNKTIIQALELNPPGHEHASTGIIANQFDVNPNCDPLAQFAFQFDKNETAPATAFTNSLGWVADRAGGHASSIRAVQWLATNYPTQSWFIPAHPERRLASDGPSPNGWTLKSLRELNDAGPSVFFGFESMPGHQKSSQRGEYSASSMGGGSYGGCGIYTARVGGVWDNMLAEGRQFWLFASSDFHNTGADYGPGEYQKTYTWVQDLSAQSIVNGLRSGNSFIVNGDLINALDFTVTNQSSGQIAGMGQYLAMSAGDTVTVNIRFKSPAYNNNGDANLVNLLQLIQAFNRVDRPSRTRR